MRDYGKVHSSFWSSETIAALSEDGRMLALYLMTSPHSTIAGVFRLPDGYAAEDLRWTHERVAKGFQELAVKGFATRCEATKWVWVTKHLEWNPPENPNQRKAAAKCAGQVPAACVWLHDFLLVKHEELGLPKPPEKQKPSPTVPKGLPNQEQEQEQKAGAETGAGTVAAGSADANATAPSAALSLFGDVPSPAPLPPAPKPPATKEPSPSAETWDSYSMAYITRYGAEPVRNATVNGQLAQFVSRIGAAEAPAVARFYVGVDDGFYVKQMHPVGLLLKDAEKLRTQWATAGRRQPRPAAARGAALERALGHNEEDVIDA